jgi:hypothetical protein
MPTRILSLLALICLATALHAQSQAPARYQIYAGYSFLSNSLNGIPGSHKPLNGWDAAMGFPAWHGLRVKFDVSSYDGTNLGASQHSLYIMSGGQYSRRFGKGSVFVDGLAGTGSANKYWGPNGLYGESVSFASLVGGGLDTPITKHIAYRVSGGYQYSYFSLEKPVSEIPYRISGLPTNFGRLSTGLVYQFK